MGKDPRLGWRCLGVCVGVLAALGIASGASAKPTGPGPGNSPNAKACQKGGWESLVRSDGTAFASEEECVSYAGQGGVLTPSSLAVCKQQLADAGLSEPADANYILGTSGDDDFTSQMTSGNDVVCGFGGHDKINDPLLANANAPLATGDIFLGGEGDDFLRTLDGGTFNGGAGNDGVVDLSDGTFNGGDGNDSVFGFFSGGTFNGGDGNDDVDDLYGGTFNGEGGCDTVSHRYGGTFNPGDQSTCTVE